MQLENQHPHYLIAKTTGGYHKPYYTAKLKNHVSSILAFLAQLNVVFNNKHSIILPVER